MVGIYKITNLKNGKVYVGQSTDIKSRLRSHKGALRSNNHNNCWLQQDWNEYGEEAFAFEVIHKCRSVFLDQAERYFIREHNSTNRSNGYNIHPGNGRDHHDPKWRLEPLKPKSYGRHYYANMDMSFFRNEENKIEYNPLCVECERGCKQSHKALIMLCPKIAKKR